jgi:type IX secretion system PorP/SprF family membrane protein
MFSARGQSVLIRDESYLNPVIANPAVSGSEFDPMLNVSASKSWLGIPGSPSTQMISTSLRIGNYDFYNPKMFLNKTKLKAYEKIGMGLAIYNQTEGPVANRGAQIAYAYHVPFQKSRLAFGLAGTFNSHILDQSEFRPVIPIDPLIDYTKENINVFNANIGVYYYTADYFAGLSALNLFSNSKYKKENNRIYSLQGGYIFKNIGSLMVEPSAFLKYDAENKLYYNIYSKLYFPRLHWVAIGYHSSRALSFMGALRLRKLYLCYVFKTNLSKIFRYNAGTHQVGLGMNIGTRRLEGF